MAVNKTWIIEDHLCRFCSGRILRCHSGNGVTGGGNPIYKCADCGKSVAAMNPDALCWCGFSHRNNPQSNPYTCLSFKILEERPELLNLFRSCGFEPNNGEVGVVLVDGLRKATEKERV